MVLLWEPKRSHHPTTPALRTQRFLLTFKITQPVLPLKKITAVQTSGKVLYPSPRKGRGIKTYISMNSLHKVLLQEVVSFIPQISLLHRQAGKAGGGM